MQGTSNVGVEPSKIGPKVRCSLERIVVQDNTRLHSCVSGPENNPALLSKPECGAVLPEPIKYEWALISSYTTRLRYLAHDDLCQEDSPSPHIFHGEP